MLSSSHFYHVVSLVWNEVSYFCGDACVEFVCNSKLAPVVESPCEELVLVIEVEAMVVPAKYVNCIFGTKFLNFEGLIVFVSRIKHPSNLARFCITPAIYLATLCQS